MKKKWTYETCKEEASKHTTVKEWRLSSPSSYNISTKSGWMVEISTHMIRPRNKWKYEELKELVKMGGTLGEFRNNHKSTYTAIKTNKWHELLDFLDRIYVKRGFWTKEEVLKEARKYEYRSEWFKNNKSSYTKARKLNIVEECVAHMKHCGDSSIMELELLTMIKESYPTAIRKDFKHNGKKAQLDIYIPELNKGIEFNGRYWHSFEGLQRSYPPENLTNG